MKEAINIAANFLKSIEGFRSKAYKDSAGVLTIGYGTTKDVIPNLKENDKITREQADIYLREKLKRDSEILREYISYPLNKFQTAALLSFIYNTGTTAFRDSTLLRRINKGDTDLEVTPQILVTYTGEPVRITNEFERWVFAGGKAMKGLHIRRKLEYELFNKE